MGRYSVGIFPRTNREIIIIEFLLKGTLLLVCLRLVGCPRNLAIRKDAEAMRDPSGVGINVVFRLRASAPIMFEGVPTSKAVCGFGVGLGCLFTT